MKRESRRCYWQLVFNAQARGMSFVVFDLARGTAATIGVDIDFAARGSLRS